MYINSHKARKEVINKQPSRGKEARWQSEESCCSSGEGYGNLASLRWRHLRQTEGQVGSDGQLSQHCPPSMQCPAQQRDSTLFAVMTSVEVFLIKRSSAFPDAHLVRATSGWRGSW